MSTDLYLISFSHLYLIFFCLHLTSFCGNLSPQMVPQTVAHLSFATCFSIWLLYHFTIHFLSLYPLPLSSLSHFILPVAIVKESRRLVGSSFNTVLKAQLDRAPGMDDFVLAALSIAIGAVNSTTSIPQFIGIT